MNDSTRNRPSQDVGNVMLLEHVNITIPDQETATTFYVTGLGFTRDPYMMVGSDNMWVNVGRQQFHMPKGPPQRFRGVVGLVVPDIEALEERLSGVAGALEGTLFEFRSHKDVIDVTGPWGNTFRLHASVAGFPGALGLAYLEIAVPAGTANDIAAFYEQALRAPARVRDVGSGSARAEVCVGPGQRLIYRESAGAAADYDGHHIAIYVADFSGPYDWLNERGLVTVEDNDHQYRCQDLVPPHGGRAIWTLEHEIRSLHHPHWNRWLVNRAGPDRLGGLRLSP